MKTIEFISLLIAVISLIVTFISLFCQLFDIHILGLQIIRKIFIHKNLSTYASNQNKYEDDNEHIKVSTTKYSVTLRPASSEDDRKQYFQYIKWEYSCCLIGTPYLSKINKTISLSPKTRLYDNLANVDNYSAKCYASIKKRNKTYPIDNYFVNKQNSSGKNEEQYKLIFPIEKEVIGEHDLFSFIFALKWEEAKPLSNPDGYFVDPSGLGEIEKDGKCEIVIQSNSDELKENYLYKLYYVNKKFPFLVLPVKEDYYVLKDIDKKDNEGKNWKKIFVISNCKNKVFKIKIEEK